MVVPKLLSDYIASDAGAELRDRLFDPAFFNRSIGPRPTLQ